jgi:hypothetical protein
MPAEWPPPAPTEYPTVDSALVPLTVSTDARHGGRWTSLRAGAREWLWRHPDPAVSRARQAVRPGDGFVDAGGVEECLPTVDGDPDHGGVWSVPWESHGDRDVVGSGGLSLARTLTVRNSRLRADYTITGEPGTPFVHAVHALLDVGPRARLVIGGPQTASTTDHGIRSRLDRRPGGCGEALSGVEQRRPVQKERWPPMVAGVPADRLGPVDATAVAILLPGCGQVRVVDDEDCLDLRWQVQGASGVDPCSLLVWRNLGGWPAGAPYRSVGIEPMVGRTTTVPPMAARSDAQVAGAARIPVGSTLRWCLEITARRHPPATPPRPVPVVVHH